MLLMLQLINFLYNLLPAFHQMRFNSAALPAALFCRFPMRNTAFGAPASAGVWSNQQFLGQSWFRTVPTIKIKGNNKRGGNII